MVEYTSLCILIVCLVASGNEWSSFTVISGKAWVSSGVEESLDDGEEGDDEASKGEPMNESWVRLV